MKRVNLEIIFVCFTTAAMLSVNNVNFRSKSVLEK